MPESNFTLILTRHAVTRMSQRGERPEDLDLILSCGTQVAPDAWLMKRADADREIAALKRRIQQLERLKKKNLKVVVEGGIVITCYPSGPADQKRTFRRGAERAA